MKLSSMIKTFIKAPVYLPPTTDFYGGLGLYWRYDRRMGIKIARELHSNEMQLEAEQLIELNRVVPHLFPKFYFVLPVFYKGLETYGLFMEHIDGKELFDKTDADPIWEFVGDELQRLKEHGFKWNDAHEGNIKLDRHGRIRFLDAWPGGFDDYGSQQRYRRLQSIY